MQRSLAEMWKTPVFASLAVSRRSGSILLGAGLLHLGLSFAGVPFWTCPIRATTGIPCPGCGLTRAVFELLRGDWNASLRTHVFAPVAVLGMVLLLAVTLLPETLSQTLRGWIRQVETSSGVSALLLLALLLYYLTRMMGYVPFPQTF